MKTHIPKLLLSTCYLTCAGTPLLAVAQNAPPSNEAAPAAAPGVPASEADAAGYAYGVNFGQQLYRLGLTSEVPIDSIARGLKDGLAGKTTTPPDMQLVMHFVKGVTDANFARNQAAAKQFLEHNAAEKGVKKTPSGLEYKIIAAGNTKAQSPKPTDAVTIRYTGKLLDGTEFDSSRSRDTPPTLALAGVIKGWQEALPMMKPGAKWQLFVPPELGYGASFKPGIPVGSLLIFDVELVSVVPPPSPNPPAAKSSTGDGAPTSGTDASAR
jgi:FKBP-type peptidyl-prolyl cis-trans isomerase